jgi:hypothetical protein
MINIIAAVNNARNVYENNFNTKPNPPLSSEVPSNKFVIQTGLILDTNIAPSPNVQTTISEAFLLYSNSSNAVITCLFFKVFKNTC